MEITSPWAKFSHFLLPSLGLLLIILTENLFCIHSSLWCCRISFIRVGFFFPARHLFSASLLRFSLFERLVLWNQALVSICNSIKSPTFLFAFGCGLQTHTFFQAGFISRDWWVEIWSQTLLRPRGGRWSIYIFFFFTVDRHALISLCTIIKPTITQ